jgi:hypothetical protein
VLTAAAFAAATMGGAALVGVVVRRGLVSCLTPCSVAVERSRWSSGRLGHLLEPKVIPRLDEGAEGTTAADFTTDGGILLAEAADEGEDEQLLVNGRT